MFGPRSFSMVVILIACSSHSGRNNQGHRLTVRVFTLGARWIAAITGWICAGNSIPLSPVRVFTARARCNGTGNSIPSLWARVFSRRARCNCASAPRTKATSRCITALTCRTRTRPTRHAQLSSRPPCKLSLAPLQRTCWNPATARHRGFSRPPAAPNSPWALRNPNSTPPSGNPATSSAVAWTPRTWTRR